MAATTAAADAAAARARPCRATLALREAKKIRKRSRKKLMLKLYLEGLKTKLRPRARTGEGGARRGLAHAAQPGRAHNSWRRDTRISKSLRRRVTTARLRLFADKLGRREDRALPRAMRRTLERTLKNADARGLDRTGLKTQEIVARQAL